MTKNKKIESYGKLPLNSLLRIDKDVLTDEEREALETEIDKKQLLDRIKKRKTKCYGK